MRTIVYIHGANSSSVSFNYIKAKLPIHNAIDIEYDCRVPLQQTIGNLQTQFSNAEPFSIVAHSLGGIIAVYLATTPVEKIVTLSTPFGGSKEADLLKWLHPSQLFNDICTSSWSIRNIPQTKVPMLSFVTNGHPTNLIREPNDGIVSVQSQRALKGPHYIELDVNHYEVLLHPEPVRHVSTFIF